MIIRKIVANVAIKRVAGYARVSTLSEQQEESYETQLKYYTDLIQSTEGWEMVKIYADDGISGTQAKKRPQFMQMIADAQAGKIDLICHAQSSLDRHQADLTVRPAGGQGGRMISSFLASVSRGDPLDMTQTSLEIK